MLKALCDALKETKRQNSKLKILAKLKFSILQNEQKVAFFGLQSATVEVLQDGAVSSSCF